MLPFISFEWVWDLGHLVFHGGLWFALNVIGLAMTYCVLKTVYDSFTVIHPKFISSDKKYGVSVGDTVRYGWNGTDEYDSIVGVR